MKAAQITGFGGKEVVQVTDEASRPTAGDGQVVVEVRAASVNPFDWKLQQGLTGISLEFPAILGGDLAGVAAEVGPGVTGIKPGDEVYGMANPVSGTGSFAEFAPVPAGQLAAKPSGTSFEEAAALPLAGVSAYQALVETIGLKSGQKILIHGGAGGIGTIANQLAKQLGAEVATTVKAEDSDYVKSLGADVVIDYTSQRFEDLIKDYDAVFDTVGGEVFAKSYQVLKRGGMLVSMTDQPNEELDQRYGVTSISQFTRATTERLQKLAELVEAGKVKPRIDRVFPLDEAAEALDYVRRGEHQGKVVVAVTK